MSPCKRACLASRATVDHSPCSPVSMPTNEIWPPTRTGAAYLNDMIYAASCEVSHPLPPVRDLAIIDHMVGTEGADTFQLLVRRRRGNNRRTHHLRDLQRGD